MNIEEFVDVAVMQDIQDEFAEATGLAAFIIGLGFSNFIIVGILNAAPKANAVPACKLFCLYKVNILIKK